MPRLIDADELHNALKKQQRWIVKREGFTNEGYSYDQVHFAIDKMPTVDVESLIAKHEDIGYEKGYRDGYAEALEVTDDAEPTEEQVKEYCRKRGLVIVTSDLFNEMKARWSAEPVRHGHWLSIGNTALAACQCGYITDRYKTYRYCPNCGAKMDEGRK